jgi:hypothetical protein
MPFVTPGRCKINELNLTESIIIVPSLGIAHDSPVSTRGGG